MGAEKNIARDAAVGGHVKLVAAGNQRTPAIVAAEIGNEYRQLVFPLAQKIRDVRHPTQTGIIMLADKFSIHEQRTAGHHALEGQNRTRAGGLLFLHPLTAQPARAFLRPLQGIAVGVEKKLIVVMIGLGFGNRVIMPLSTPTHREAGFRPPGGGEDGFSIPSRGGNLGGDFGRGVHWQEIPPAVEALVADHGDEALQGGSF